MSDWRTEAACGPHTAELFHDESTHREAKQVCDGCPVLFECLEFALENPDLSGIWGGMDGHERSRFRRERERRVKEVASSPPVYVPQRRMSYDTVRNLFG